MFARANCANLPMTREHARDRIVDARHYRSVGEERGGPQHQVHAEPAHVLLGGCRCGLRLAEEGCLRGRQDPRWPGCCVLAAKLSTREAGLQADLHAAGGHRRCHSER